MKIKIGSKRLKEENHVTFLGVLIDSTLSWKPHIIEFRKKLTKTTGIFCKLRYYIPRNLYMMLYNALIYPLLLYGITSWSLIFT